MAYEQPQAEDQKRHEKVFGQKHGSEPGVRQVNRRHPSLGLNWRSLREQANSRNELLDARSESVRKLLTALRAVNLDLADLFPAGLNVTDASRTGAEILLQLRLLHSTVGLKLDQFREAGSGLTSRERKAG